MTQLIPTAPTQKNTARTTTVTPCTHGRLVDEVRTMNGGKTGQLICIECLAVFPDPLYQKPLS
jgi:hypothetical protein